MWFRSVNGATTSGNLAVESRISSGESGLDEWTA